LNEIDAFAASLLEEAKRFLERAREAKDEEGEAPNLHAALMLAFCSLEAHVNAVADEISLRRNLSTQVLAVIKERELRLKDGEFILDQNKLKNYRIEDRILALHRVGVKPNIDGAWRASLAAALDLRNKLTHPKIVPAITEASVIKAIEAVIDTIDALYSSVYKRRFPAVHRRLQSKLDF
jgi:hypothetical protein